MKSSLLAVVVICACAYGQHAAAQALGESVRINQQSLQGMGTANRPGIPLNPGDAQQTVQGQPGIQEADAQRPLPDCKCAGQPLFSVTSANLAPGTQVIITSPSRDAVIFYTTDGWTPTAASTRYTGPITITADTKLQAIAEEPQKLPSAIAEVDYTVDGPQTPKPQSVQTADGVLRKGTALRLVTNADVTSDAAQAGDPLPLLLDENVMDGETIVAPKGTEVEATLTHVDPAGPDGKPGVLAFEVRSLAAHGVTIPLAAKLTLAALDPAAQMQHIENASLVHVAGAQPHGEEAEITPGMALTAYVSADTAVKP